MITSDRVAVRYAELGVTCLLTLRTACVMGVPLTARKKSWGDAELGFMVTSRRSRWLDTVLAVADQAKDSTAMVPLGPSPGMPLTWREITDRSLPWLT